MCLWWWTSVLRLVTASFIDFQVQAQTRFCGIFQDWWLQVQVQAWTWKSVSKKPEEPKLHQLGTCKGPDSPPNFQAWAMCGWPFTIWVSIICTFVQLKGPALATTFSSNAIEKQHFRFICVKPLFYTKFVFNLHLWVLKNQHSASRLICSVETLISSFTGHSGKNFNFFSRGRSWVANAKQ